MKALMSWSEAWREKKAVRMFSAAWFSTKRREIEAAADNFDLVSKSID